MKTRLYQMIIILLAVFCIQDSFAQGALDEGRQRPIDDAIIGGAIMRTDGPANVAIDEIITEFETDQDEDEGEEELEDDRHINLDNLTNNRLELFPNPASNVFNLVMSTRGDYQISIYDLSGKLIDQSYHTGINSISIDVRDYTPSLYLVHIEGAEINETQKLKISR